MSGYIARSLVYVDADGQEHRLSETQLGQSTAPTVVLGEPGMGKTALLETLGGRPGFHYITAKGLLRRTPTISPGEVLVIDALDEVAAARDEDPVHQVLTRLVELDAPRFVMSCRGADWRGAIARHDISEDYGQPPLELRLTPLTRDDALAYLAGRLDAPQAEHVLEDLENKSLESLYGNPLMLKLVARLAADGALPPTRAQMFDRACRLLGSEQNPRHGRSRLAGLGEETILLAAGAAFAALILTGSEAICRDPSIERAPGDLHVADLSILPRAGELDAVVGSNLFRPLDGPGERFGPLHRAIAEFLGAKWLAAQLDGNSTRQVMSLLTFNGGVPASLRGLHAWLARFSPALASQVIDTDPYGVLRYGDPDHLTPSDGRRLLVALERLAKDDPWFRMGDWSRLSAAGLTQPTLLGDIRDKLTDPGTTFHMRSLLLDAVRGSKIAADLAPDLKAMVLSSGDHSFNFSERSAAADALLAMGGIDQDWLAIIVDLHRREGADDRRLAVELMTDIGPERFEAGLIAEAALSYLGLLPTSAGKHDADTVGPLHLLARKIPADRIEPVLDALTGYDLKAKSVGWETRYALTNLVDTLITRCLEAGRPDPLRLLSWLRLVRSREGIYGGQDKSINRLLTDDTPTRQAIQRHVLLVETDHDNAWNRFWRLSGIDAAFHASMEDVVALLAPENFPDRDQPGVRDNWRDVVRLGARQEGLPPEILAAAQPFARGDEELEAYLRQLKRPYVPEWQKKDEARKRAEAKARDLRWSKHRRDFADNVDKIRAGEFSWIVPAARAYFARFTDMDNDLSPRDRIGQWLGEDLVEPVLAGFEAVLHRPDLPGAQVMSDSYAQSRRWHVVEPLLAAMCERVKGEVGLTGLSEDVLFSARLGLVHEHIEEKFGGAAVEALLDDWLGASPALFERYARLLIEPQLEPPQTHVRGLYQLARPKGPNPALKALAVEWLERFPNMELSAEDELISYLLRVEAWSELQAAARARLAAGFDKVEHRLAWLATASLVDFEAVRDELTATAQSQRDLLWYIRSRGWPERHDDWSLQYSQPGRLEWFIQTFRQSYPFVSHPNGSSRGDQNDWNATDFISSAIRRLAADTSDDAIAALMRLRDAPEDGYTMLIKSVRVEQRQTRLEADFQPATLPDLVSLARAEPPRTVASLQALALDTLDRFQAQLRGDALGRVDRFYGPDGPLDENTCRDWLAIQLEDSLRSHDIQIIPERAMPKGRRADLVLALGDLQLPIEAKGQWNRELWTAADLQLDAFYATDWRASGVGIYLVFWFGADMARPRHLQAPPSSLPRPATPEALRQALLDQIPEHRKGAIEVFVLDASR